MFFNEAPPTAYDLRFNLLGIPVRVSPFFWLGALFLGMGGNPQPKEMFFWIATVFVSILVHEMGHALTARAHGWQPRITLSAFGGLASYQPTRNDARAQVLITLAGPAAGFLFAFLIWGGLQLAGHPIAILPDRESVLSFEWQGEPFQSRNMNMLVGDLLFVNIFWGLVNLLPVYPLDGGRIARVVLSEINSSEGVRQSLWLGVFVGVAMAVFSFVRMQSTYTAFFFAYMAFMNYQELQTSSFRPGGWGGYR